MAKPKKKPTNISNWLDEADEVPRRRSLATKDRARRQRLYRWVIQGSVIMMPITLVMCLLFAASASGHRTSSSTQAASVDVKGRTAATLSLQQWLRSKPSPVAGTGEIVSYDGQTELQKPANPTDQNGKVTVISAPYTTELQHFTITDGLGQTFTADVTVASDKTFGATVLAGPALLPVPAADSASIQTESSSASGTWPGFYDTSASGAVTSAVNVWAQAFAKGDSPSMRLAMQDKQSSHGYQTLRNVQSVTANVTTAAFNFGSVAANSASQGKSTGNEIVRVTLTVLWKGNPAPAAGTDPSTLPSVTYDLLVQSANTSAPAVVAWGSPGTGPTLQPYQNALVGSALQGTAVAPTAAPSGGSATTGN